MKTSQDRAGIRPGRAWATDILGGLIAGLMVAMPAWAGDPAASGPGGSGPFVSGGDETVGTLPIVDGGRGTLEYRRFWRSVRPAYYLEGTTSELANTILDAQGSGYVSQEVVDSLAGRVRLTFHGDVEITLDRQMLQVSAIGAGLAVPRGFGAGSMAVISGAQPPVRSSLAPGLVRLPLRALESSGVLDAGDFEILTTAKSGIGTAHVVTATTDVLILSQSY